MRKRILLLISLSLILTVVIAPFAKADSENEFETKKYDVQINVKEDNSAYINEKININATSDIHGIYRYIPLSAVIKYNDSKGNPIKKSRATIKMEDVSVVNDPFKFSKKNGNGVIRIGDENKTFTGKHNYNLSYLIRNYDDGIKEYDSFYYNVLPTNWETPIEKTNIVITFPKSFDKKKVDIYTGKQGKRDEGNKIKWKVEGNTITISSKETLDQGVGITAAVQLPEGYFKGELSHSWVYIAIYALALIVAAFLILLWFKFGRDPKSVQVVEFNPPDGISSAEIGYIVDGGVDKKDVISLIFYFAQKGYLSIEELEKEKKGKQDFILHKEKELSSSAKTFERTFFYGLFGLGDQVKLSDLGKDFYDNYISTATQIQGEFTENKERRIFAKSASLARIGGVVISTIGMVGIGLFSSILFGRTAMWMIGVVILTIGVLISYAMGASAEDRKYVLNKASGFTTTLVSLLILAVCMGLTIFLMWWIIGALLGGILAAIMMAAGYFAIRFMRARTKNGAKLLGEILGFKEFIKVAELEKLEMMVEENPNYFYDVLPYAYVLGLSKKWAKKFEGINMEQPDWYRGNYLGNNMFNTWIFFSAFNNFTSFASSNIGVPHVDSNFGGSGGSGFGGGGGFSGGGFGGGGGGSW